MPLQSAPQSAGEVTSGPVLTAQDIREFQDIVESETGVRLEGAAAWSSATELIALCRMLLGRIPEDPES